MKLHNNTSVKVPIIPLTADMSLHQIYFISTEYLSCIKIIQYHLPQSRKFQFKEGRQDHPRTSHSLQYLHRKRFQHQRIPQGQLIWHKLFTRTYQACKFKHTSMKAPNPNHQTIHWNHQASSALHHPLVSYKRYTKIMIRSLVAWIIHYKNYFPQKGSIRNSIGENTILSVNLNPDFKMKRIFFEYYSMVYKGTKKTWVVEAYLG